MIQNNNKKMSNNCIDSVMRLRIHKHTHTNTKRKEENYK